MNPRHRPSTQTTTARMRLRIPAAFAFAFLFGLAHAQDPAAAAPQGQELRQSRATLRQLGVDYEITLRGIEGTAGVPFPVRSDQVVQRATLHLKYSYSPALLPDLSHLKVTVNGVTAATVPVPAEDGGRDLERDIELDPRLFVDHNWINLQLIGHYTRDCEDPDHTSLWANIDRGSYIELAWAPLQLADDLSLLPLPFFDPRDTARLELPFVFAGQPSNATLQAAGITASWFGALAGYRGALFPAYTGMLPAQGHAVLFGTPRNPPPGVELPEVEGPTLAVATHPQDPNAKLLLVLGRDEDELRTAASALALGTPLAGERALVRDFREAAPRKPYDAPAWLPGDRPVRFDELVPDTAALNVRGYHPDLVRIGLRLAPDLFVWESEGIPVNLRYRYTLPEGANRSALNVSINDAFVATLPLDGRPRGRALPVQLWHQVAPKGRMPIEQPLRLPTGPFSASSQLRFHFFFDRPVAEACKNTFPDVSAAIDGDSTIDVSGFAHFIAMPNLAAFGNAGFPFTRLADLAETALVMPDNPGADDVANALALFGRMGASTGYPALRARVVSAAQVEQHAGRDLLVLGSRRNQPLFERWAAHLPVGGQGEDRRFALSDWIGRKLPFLSPDARRTDLPTTAEVAVRPEAGDVVLMGFESPLHARRSVVALMADDPAQATRLFEAWFDPQKLALFQGSVVLLQRDRLVSLAGNQTYHVGRLPPLTAMRWFFANHPLWLAVLVCAGSLLLALLARGLLRRRAAARLKSGA